tara:strand:- start:62 stop:556 length:495 start_codon:yes stop_codon:yes gene_type:complete
MITITEDGKIFDKDGEVHQYLKKSGLRGQKYWTTKKYGAVHRLIASTFIPNPDNKSEVDHINGIATDNRLENLRWVTQEENKALHNCCNIFYITDGKTIYVTYNVCRFCKVFGLDQSALRKTSSDTKAKDKRKRHKGYSILKKEELKLEDRNPETILLPFIEKK